MLNLLPLAQVVSEPQTAWLPVVLLIVIGLLFVVGTLVMSIAIGPHRTGPGKELAYESGMVPVGDARQRFNVRFYLVAMIFLVFDVEIVFFYPWATIYPDALADNSPYTGRLLAEMLLFAGLLMVAYLYAWGKGVFRWD
jgi:NADH-quinone oxidoreductase subunit A